jgi:hypothetical protein
MTSSPKLVLLFIASLLGASPALAHATSAKPIAAVQAPATEPAQEHKAVERPAGGEAKKVDIILPHQRLRRARPVAERVRIQSRSSAALGACNDRQLRLIVADETRRHDDSADPRLHRSDGRLRSRPPHRRRPSARGLAGTVEAMVL